MANTQDTSSGKTSPEHFLPTAEKISAVSSKPSVRSKTAAFQFLDLRENGQKPERFWQNPIPSHGEFLMHNTGECPIYLVADFAGRGAGKILFESEGLSGYSAESLRAWQRTAGDIKTGTHKTGTDDVECYDISDRRRVADRSEVSPTLTTKMGTGGNNVPIVLENHPQDSRVTIAEDGNVPTLTSRMGTGGAMCQ